MSNIVVKLKACIIILQKFFELYLQFLQILYLAIYQNLQKLSYFVKNKQNKDRKEK